MAATEPVLTVPGYTLPFLQRMTYSSITAVRQGMRVSQLVIEEDTTSAIVVLEGGSGRVRDDSDGVRAVSDDRVDVVGTWEAMPDDMRPRLLQVLTDWHEQRTLLTVIHTDRLHLVCSEQDGSAVPFLPGRS